MLARRRAQQVVRDPRKTNRKTKRVEARLLARLEFCVDLADETILEAIRTAGRRQDDRIVIGCHMGREHFVDATCPAESFLRRDLEGPRIMSLCAATAVRSTTGPCPGIILVFGPASAASAPSPATIP